MLPDHKTKIICTIGPASESLEVLEKMIRAGMDIARLNFSHGDYDRHRQVIGNIRSAAKAAGRRVAILADLPGPEDPHREAGARARRPQCRRRIHPDDGKHHGERQQGLHIFHQAPRGGEAGRHDLSQRRARPARSARRRRRRRCDAASPWAGRSAPAWV